MANGFNYTLPELPYREYVAFLTQDVAPEASAIIIYNSLGFVPDIIHDSEGSYRIADFNARFPENKTVVLFGNVRKIGAIEYNCYYLNEANILLFVYTNGTLVDNSLLRFPITIRIYP